MSLGRPPVGTIEGPPVGTIGAPHSGSTLGAPMGTNRGPPLGTAQSLMPTAALFYWEELDRLERMQSVTINPIKMKLIANKLRHKAQGYVFARKRPGEVARDSQVSSVASERLLPGTPSLSVGEDGISRNESSSVLVHGPNNMLGLQTIFLHPFSLLLICVPLGILSPTLGWSASWTFWLNFVALIPLAKILGDATEELAASLRSDTISGLLNATFGNAVEMIVAVQSLRAGLLEIVKESLLGSVLSNILLVLGTAFLLGGLTLSNQKSGRFHSFKGDNWKDHFIGLEKEQKFPLKNALISMAMLLFSCMSFALPTIFNAFNPHEEVLVVSRIGAFIVASSYVMYLTFQLFTHTHTLMHDENAVGSDVTDDYADSDVESASITTPCAVLLMALTTVVVGLCSEFLVDAIQAVVEEAGIPQTFIGVILLPIAGNACEHASAIRFAMQDRPGLAIGIAVGSSTQVALLVVPFAVVAGWVLDRPLDLDFGILNTAVVTLSVLVVLTLLMDGRSNWLKGYILCSLYAFIAVLYCYVPMSGSNTETR